MAERRAVPSIKGSPIDPYQKGPAHPVTFRFPDTQLEAVRALAKAEGVTVSDLIRAALEQYLRTDAADRLRPPRRSSYLYRSPAA